MVGLVGRLEGSRNSDLSSYTVHVHDPRSTTTLLVYSSYTPWPGEPLMPNWSRRWKKFNYKKVLAFHQFGLADAVSFTLNPTIPYIRVFVAGYTLSLP